jgi:hypothetical protein
MAAPPGLLRCHDRDHSGAALRFIGLGIFGAAEKFVR